MINYEDSSEIESIKVNYHVLELIYENLNLMDENINLTFENRKLMKRIEKTMKFEGLVSKVSGVRDVTSWKQRTMELESILKNVVRFCPSGYKNEIWKVLKNNL